MARTRLWSYSTPNAEAYIEVDVVADEAVSVHWFNSTSVPVTVTFQWKNNPTPSVVVIDGVTDGEESIAIPPGQRKWVVLGEDNVDTEVLQFTTEAG